ncbi:uncharacterized protein LOC104896251 [Beta vulgaris subsp. vulgaris]|uniref:uncharacterized protein LOC104896251 n=1 Tax=Beta vulgaris subsp. vulgaris TaxID=3555 RepID=UPI002036DDFB|nr:uncharacterized protein LOC104896251 [Beta vulgaris subsp. vulgaris]
MDQNGMNCSRESEEFKSGLNAFLDDSFANVAIEGQILCPCKRCCRRFCYSRDEIYDHVIVNGFVKGFKDWVINKEASSSTCKDNINTNESYCDNSFDDIDGLLQDTFRDMNEGLNVGEENANGPNEEARKFYKLVEEGKQELYPGCKTFSKLSFLIRLYLFKCLNGISNVAFGDLLELLREAFPMAQFPKSFDESKNIVRNLGLDYKKIHACPNDCILYRKELEGDNICPKCETSRWKSDKIPAKVLRYFPLKPRLQRLYMCSKTAELMIWHDKKRTQDEYIRHLADGQSWKDFDSSHRTFAIDPRNVRLALASDGFNPFQTMSVAHSTWPVVLINYNLPPWLSMKPEYFMLSLLIPGPKSPGNDIDVYLQPLIDELKELWEDGVETYDAFKKQTFQLHAALLGTINDFPAYSMLSGWATKGNYACPSCNHDVRPHYLDHSGKNCYMDHRRLLDMGHPWRNDKKSFNGEVEDRVAPSPLWGTDLLNELKDFVNDFGKRKKGLSKGKWKKKSVFLELQSWANIKYRHNLDVMHIEKNFFDNIINTLLDVPGKTKDHIKARLDLMDLNIKPHLHPFPSEDGKRLLVPPAPFTMGNVEKDLFLKVFKDAKLPYGYASNIARCVQVKERRFTGYKSHDAHVLLHHLLQVAVRKTLPKSVVVPLIRLGNFFRGICSKILCFQELDKLAYEVVEIHCQFEMIFPPVFFDVMVHLPSHLVDEIKYGGPVQYRWMYFVERYLGKLKSYVRNRSRPEGSITEGYMIEECLTFCSRYLHDGVKTRLDRRCARQCEMNQSEDDSSFFPKVGHPIGGKRTRNGKGFSLDVISKKQAHRYIIFNCNNTAIEKYIEEHQQLVNSHRRKRRWDDAQSHSNDFIDWFQEKVQREQVDGQLFWLAKGPNTKARRYMGYFVNGYRFCTKGRDSRIKTQNSGVTLIATTSSFASSRDQNPVDEDVTYYGVIEEIIELDFWSQFSVVLFKCQWFLANVDEFGLTFVNFKKKCSQSDPFVLASQVHQVFYVQDPQEHDIHYVMQRVPRDLFDFEEAMNEETYWEEAMDSSGSDIPNVDASDTYSRASGEVRSVEITYHEEDFEHDDTDWDWMHADTDT